MKVLIIGKGGREHALAAKLAQNKNVSQIYIVQGNAGSNLLSNVQNIDLKTIEEFLEFAVCAEIDLTIVGSEDWLVAGIVDKFQEQGLRIFGPNRQAAMLEGSKVFAKEFMQKHGVKTAKYAKFDDFAAAVAYLDTMDYPVVIKASGLAAGKGVIISENYADAKTALHEIMVEKVFGDSGNEVVIEEFLRGVEASILSFTDSQVILPMISAKDHKKIGENETGLNTGGMGVIAPNPYVTEEVNQAFIRDILQPTLAGFKAEGMNFCGVVFFGLMITDNGVYLIEYNMRFGDPETQAVLALLDDDLLDIFNLAIDKKLAGRSIQWSKGAACCVVLASGGYPEKFPTGIEIIGIEEFPNLASHSISVTDTGRVGIKTYESCQVFVAGASFSDGKYLTAGGRVLNIVATAENLEQARAKAYAAIDKISFAGMYYRQDIGKIN